MSPAPKAEGKRVQVLSEIDNSDLKAARNEFIFRTPYLVEALTPLLKDPRDEPMLCLMLNIVEVVGVGLPLVYGVHTLMPEFSGVIRHGLGLAYVLTIVLLFQMRFTLLLHFASHRPIFHNEFLNGMLVWIFAPFFGIPPGVYKIHHVIMHHIENNHELDVSSTENYQRDSLLDFMRYWFHFTVLIWIELPNYCIKTQRWSWLAKSLSGIFVYVVFLFTVARNVNLSATVWCFIVPNFIAMTAMAFGNWSQHIFVNPENYSSNFGLTYNCMDTPDNQMSFNDGYHVVHHMNARLHWSEMPDYFYQNKERHLNEGALTFRGVHFFDVGVLVFTNRLERLAEKYVHLGEAKDAPTVKAVEAKLREWLKPVAAKKAA